MKHTFSSIIYICVLLFFVNATSATTKEDETKEKAKSAATPEEQPVDNYVFDPSKLRDPFKSLILGKKEDDETKEKIKKRLFLEKKKLFEMRRKKIPMTPLQRFKLSALKLTVILWGEKGNYAVIKTPKGRGYTVRPGDYIGDNFGQIKEIESDQIIIEEDFFDIDETVKTKFINIKMKKEQR